MKKLLFVLLFVSFNPFLALAQTTVHCKVSTDLGSITIELFPEKAPITVSNFLKYDDNP